MSEPSEREPVESQSTIRPMSRTPTFYNCRRCPAYCCSYPAIVVSERDLSRLAKHFGMDIEKARRTLTKHSKREGARVLRHKNDDTFGSVCRFLDRAGARLAMVSGAVSRPMRSLNVRPTGERDSWKTSPVDHAGVISTRINLRCSCRTSGQGNR